MSIKTLVFVGKGRATLLRSRSSARREPRPPFTRYPVWVFRQSLVLVLLGLSLAPAVWSAEPPPLAGEWRVKSVTLYGKPQPDSVGSIYLFGKEGLVSVQPPGHEARPASTVIDLAAKPWKVELELDDDRPALGGGGPREGIMELKGDSLKICVSGAAGEPRPKKFESLKGELSILILLERVKKAAP